MHTTVNGRLGYVAIEGGDLVLRGHDSTTYQRFTLTPEAREAIIKCATLAEDLNSYVPKSKVRWDDTEESRLRAARL